MGSSNSVLPTPSPPIHPSKPARARGASPAPSPSPTIEVRSRRSSPAPTTSPTLPIPRLPFRPGSPVNRRPIGVWSFGEEASGSPLLPPRPVNRPCRRGSGPCPSPDASTGDSVGEDFLGMPGGWEFPPTLSTTLLAELHAAGRGGRGGARTPTPPPDAPTPRTVALGLGGSRRSSVPYQPDSSPRSDVGPGFTKPGHEPQPEATVVLQDRYGQLHLQLQGLEELNAQSLGRVSAIYSIGLEPLARDKEEAAELLREVSVRRKFIAGMRNAMDSIECELQLRGVQSLEPRGGVQEVSDDPDLCQFCLERPGAVEYRCCRFRGACCECAATMQRTSGLCPHCRAPSPTLMGGVAAAV